MRSDATTPGSHLPAEVDCFPSSDRQYDPRIEVHGEGPLLVYLPGMDGTGNLFYRQIPRLDDRYRVVTYTLRDDAESMKTLVDDLSCVIQMTATNGESATVVGESFGGALALSFALENPHLAQELVIINSFARFLPQLRLRLAIATIRSFPFHVIPMVRRFTANRLHSNHTHRHEIRRFLDLTSETTRHGYLNRLRILKHYDMREKLREIEVPALFLAADDDRLVPAVQQARYMTDRLPGASLHVLEGHGHACLIAPDVYLDEILDDWEQSGDRFRQEERA